MRRKPLFVLLACLGFSLLMACIGQDEAEPGPRPSPSLSDNARVETAIALQALPSSTPLPPSPSPNTPAYDPGPYFTPNRPPPEGLAQDFLPPEQVAAFRRFQVFGHCGQAQGQTAYYSRAQVMDGAGLDPQAPPASPDPLSVATLQLHCRHWNTPDQSLAALRDLRAGLPAEPLFWALQGEKSFLLGLSGPGFVYAWTQGPWLFVAQSPQGRAALDEFMQAFPY